MTTGGPPPPHQKSPATDNHTAAENRLAITAALVHRWLQATT
jgi:hypothetical protein